jgi:hypothetical protein
MAVVASRRVGEPVERSRAARGAGADRPHQRLPRGHGAQRPRTPCARPARWPQATRTRRAFTAARRSPRRHLPACEAEGPSGMTRSQWRKAIRARGACERCGSTEQLHAHHIDRDPSNNVIENGELLCASCHDAEHDAQGKLVALSAASSNPTEDTRARMKASADRRWSRPEERDRLKESEAAQAQRAENHRSDGRRQAVAEANRTRARKKCLPGCTCGRHRAHG